MNIWLGTVMPIFENTAANGGKYEHACASIWRAASTYWRHQCCSTGKDSQQRVVAGAILCIARLVKQIVSL